MNPIKVWLKERDVSITDLARKLNINRAYLSSAINGNTTLPPAMRKYLIKNNPELLAQYHSYCSDKHKDISKKLMVL